jgi:hypothetical protein
MRCNMGAAFHPKKASRRFPADAIGGDQRRKAADRGAEIGGAQPRECGLKVEPVSLRRPVEPGDYAQERPLASAAVTPASGPGRTVSQGGAAAIPARTRPGVRGRSIAALTCGGMSTSPWPMAGRLGRDRPLWSR